MKKIQIVIRDILHGLILKLPVSPWKKKVIRDFVFMVFNLPSLEHHIQPILPKVKQKKEETKLIGPISSYINAFYTESNRKGIRKEYEERDKTESLDASKLTLKCIVFYLPQFHTIPENDEWWGKGFTEWTNVTRAVPQYTGHYQPHLPGEFGFYDLRNLDIMHKQSALAAHHGLAGFCLYYYNFGGKRLLELPHLNILNNPDLKMPFCLCWANENWTRRWDGKEQEVLIEQRYSDENDIEIIKDLTKSFADPRYIKVCGRPVFLVYRPMDMPDPAKTVRNWRTYCKENNIGEIYLIAVESIERIDPILYGFDATCEFPPHQSVMEPVNNNIEILNPEYTGNIYEYKEMVTNFINREQSEFKRFSTVTPSWDNEARKPGKGFSVVDSSPYLYSRWLQYACQRTSELPADERLVFINAWNEWAESAYLEPDRQYGYAYLNATKKVLNQFKQTETIQDNYKLLERTRSGFNKSSNTAIMLHLYFWDLMDEFNDLFKSLTEPIDLFITVSRKMDDKDIIKIISVFPAAYILDVENRGRDILPFYKLLPTVINLGYHQVCKLHTKKSLHRLDGDLWRTKLWNKLLNTDNCRKVIDLFKTDSSIGLVALKEFRINLSTHPYYYINNKDWLHTLLKQLDAMRSPKEFDWNFIAGSMFWFRPSALSELYKLVIDQTDFEDESNQLDGTLAHSLERLFTLIALQSGYETRWID